MRKLIIAKTTHMFNKFQKIISAIMWNKFIETSETAENKKCKSGNSKSEFFSFAYESISTILISQNSKFWIIFCNILEKKKL